MDRIDPWGSLEISDYEHLFEDFGLEKLNDEMLSLDHKYFRRGLAVAHRDFKKIMKAMNEDEPFYCMTGFATSGKFHIGHKAVVDLIKFLKEQGAKLFIGICDIDAYTSRPDNKVPSIEASKENAVENLAHILSLGLDKEDVYIQSQMPPRYYEFSYELSKKITRNQFSAIYGHVNLGKISATLLQIADILNPQLEEFGKPMPGVVPIALEQDPHIRITRDVARKLSYDMVLPSSLNIKHVGGLQKGEKMSASKPRTAIFLSDSDEEIDKKIDEAYTGGRDTAEEQREKGAVIEEDKIYQLLRFHMDDDERLREIRRKYSSGEMLSGEIKQICKEELKNFLKDHRKKFKKNKSKAEDMVYG